MPPLAETANCFTDDLASRLANQVRRRLAGHYRSPMEHGGCRGAIDAHAPSPRNAVRKRSESHPQRDELQMAPCYSEKFRLIYYPVPKNAGTSLWNFLFE